MLYLLPTALIPMIIYSIYPILDFHVKNPDKIKYKLNCYNPSLRQDICYNCEKNICPISSYKQCTNNHYPLNKCNCFERSFELCKKEQQYCNKCYHKYISKKPDLHIITANPSTNNRVNRYHSQRSRHELLK